MTASPNDAARTRPTTDDAMQTDDDQYETIVQVNADMKRALDTFEGKIRGVVTERQDLFDGINEATDEQLDHLISTIERQAKDMDQLHTESERTAEQLREEMKALQRSHTSTLRRRSAGSVSVRCSFLTACQCELDNERRLRTEQLISAEDTRLPASIEAMSHPRVSFSTAAMEEYRKQIDELQQNLSAKENEQRQLQEHVNDVEVELRRTADDYTTATTKYQSLERERDALVEQQTSVIEQR